MLISIASFIILKTERRKDMIVLNVYYKIKDGKREEYVDRLTMADVPLLSREESGNAGKYAYYFSESDENELLLVEYWKDMDAFETHKSQKHYKEMIEIQKQYVEDVKVDKFII